MKQSSRERIDPAVPTGGISRNEWITAVAIALATVAILALPYLLGHSSTRPGTFYTGTLMNPEDSQSYFAKMLQGFDGQWLYTIPFTSVAHEPAFVGGFYLLLGHLARLAGLSLVTVWHLSQLVAAILLLLTIFWFVAIHLENKTDRRIAYLLAVYGSGLGWLLFAVGQTYWLGVFPVDFKMPEAHTFFMAMTFPHASLATTSLLVILVLLRPSDSGRQPSWRRGLAVGGLNLVLGIVYPFLMYLVLAVAALYWLSFTMRIRPRLGLASLRLASAYALAFAVPAPLYVYYAYIRQVNEVFGAWEAQAVTSSPPWPHYLVAFGLLLLLALSPVLARPRRLVISEGGRYLWLWVVAAAVMVYVPVNPQRRFVQGIHVALSVLATIGLMQVVLPYLEETRPYRWLLGLPRYSQAGLRRLLLTAFLGLMALSNLYLLADLSITTAIRQPYPFFRSEAENEAIAWLRAKTQPAAVVVSAYETGNYVAAHAGNRVVVGHWAETFAWQEKMAATSRFFSGTAGNEWMQRFLRRENVDYIWSGAREQGMGQLMLDGLANVRLVYYNDEVALYAVE